MKKVLEITGGDMHKIFNNNSKSDPANNTFDDKENVREISDHGKDDDCEMRSSSEASDWSDDKSNQSMSDSGDCSSSSPESHSPKQSSYFSPSHSNTNTVVWLEVAEHMARMKLTSTLRTALECKTRYIYFLSLAPVINWFLFVGF